ncbi:MAG: radical SAM protein [Candidatus Coatesbacteria bacterium]|nr:radical SAM protein [Candidatus Coatesbacteria bacterium]
MLSKRFPKRLFARGHKLFDVDGATILFNCQTTQISEVHQIILDTIKACDGRPTEDIIQDLTQQYSLDDVTEAVRELRLVKVAVGNERKYVYRPRPKHQRRPEISFMSLNGAEDCNLRCKYCYVNHGDFSGVRRMMARDVAKSSIDYLALVSGEQKMCHLNFFGGEPLLNFDLIKWSCDYAAKVLKEVGKAVKFDLSTNATLVTDEVIRFFKKHDFRVQVSIDGPADIHDVQRPFVDGSGCHDIIVEAMRRLKDAGVALGTATVVCGNNLSACRAFHYVHGIASSNVQITLSQVPGDPEWGFAESQMDIVREQFGTLADEYFAAFSLTNLSATPCSKRS